MRWLGRAEIEQCARGKLLVFQGDSLTRQLFNRLIWWVRGIPSVVEQYYHNDAYYAFSEQAGDAFTLRGQDGKRGASTWARIDAAVAANATLNPQRVHVLYQAFRHSKFPIDAGIAGSRFMRPDYCVHGHTEGCKVRERAGGGAAAVPWDPTRLLGLVQGQMGQLAIHRARPGGDGWDRASFSVRVLAESSPLLLERNSVCFDTKGDNLSSVDMQQLLGANRIAHGDPIALPPMCLHEDGHFQCSFNDIHSTLHTFKRPLSGDCRDLASLNTVQLILSALCGT